MLWLLATAALAQGGDAPAWRELGARTLARIEAEFRDPASGRLAESVDSQGKRGAQASFTWGLGVHLSALVAATRGEPGTYRPMLERQRDTLRTYWVEARGIGGFSASPAPSTPDRYYDDNAWVGLALIEAHHWTGDRAFLRQAEEVAKFVLSGEDVALDGGIWWHETRRESKHTCSVAPAALLSLELFAASRDPKPLETADRLMRWLRRLQDADGLYFDHVRTSGEADRTKWSYNSALPVRFFARRFALLKEAGDRDEAVRIARAARKQWQDPQTGALRDDASFAHHLLEAFLEVAALDPGGGWRVDAERAATFVEAHAKGADGRYGKRWETAPGAGDARLLLYQASAARAQWMLAHAK